MLPLILKQEILISSRFQKYISDFRIGLIIYELTSKQSHEEKLEARNNGWTQSQVTEWMISERTNKGNE